MWYRILTLTLGLSALALAIAAAPSDAARNLGSVQQAASPVPSGLPSPDSSATP